jgi:hypothetical protein
MSDSFTVTAGLVLMAVGVIAWLLYIRRPQAMLLDAVSMGWVGFVVWIGLAVFLLGWLWPDRKYRAGREEAVLLIALGLMGYMVGLALKPAHGVVSRVIPTPKDTLTVTAVWFMLVMCICAAILGIWWLQTARFSRTLSPIATSLASSGMTGAGVLAVLLITAFRRAYASKLLGLVVLAAVTALMYVTFWSRRPLPGLLGGMIALYYHLRVRHKPFGTRALYLGGTMTALFLGLLVLTATRTTRFARPGARTLSAGQAQLSMAGGLNVNVHCLEMTMLKYPRQFSFLHGTGVLPLIVWPIPRGIWPDKPVPTGGVISYQYTHTHNWSVPNTLFGEAFANFGWVGTPIFMVVAGIMVGGLNRKLRDNQYNLTAWVAWFAVLPDFTSEWRGDLTSMTVQPVVRVALFLFMAWLLAHLFPRARRLRTADLEYGLAEPYAAPAGNESRAPAADASRPGATCPIAP